MPDTKGTGSVPTSIRIAEASDYDALYATGGYVTGATDVYEHCREKTIRASLRKLAGEFSPESILEVGCGQDRWFAAEVSRNGREGLLARLALREP